MRIGYISGSVDGAIPNRTRIRKIIYEEKDGHQIGAKGIVVASMGPILWNGKDCYGYFVEWDDMPGIPVFVVGYKIEEEKNV